MIVYLVQFNHWGERPNASNGVFIAPGLIIGYLHEVLGNQLFHIRSLEVLPLDSWDEQTIPKKERPRCKKNPSLTVSGGRRSPCTGTLRVPLLSSSFPPSSSSWRISLVRGGAMLLRSPAWWPSWSTTFTSATSSDARRTASAEVLAQSTHQAHTTWWARLKLTHRLRPQPKAREISSTQLRDETVP